MTEIIHINKNNQGLINEFLSLAGTALTSFRYFDKRQITCVENHIITVVLKKDDKIVGYGHLDKEDDIVWLGIAIAQDFQGYGLSKRIMFHLIDYAERNKIPVITLSVDITNIMAQKLYEKFGFVKFETKNHYFIYKKNISV